MRRTGRWAAVIAASGALVFGATAPSHAVDPAAPDPTLVEQQIADQEKQANDSIVQRDYADWEAEQSLRAADALAHRLTLASVADQAEQEAAAEYDTAQEHATNALGAASVEQAAEAHARAVATHDRALLLAEHAREQAEAEEVHLTGVRQDAIGSQIDLRDAATAQLPADTLPAFPMSDYAWTTFVANVDSQEAIDACEGGLTYSPEISDILGKPYYPIHNFCKGLPILDLQVGDLVYIEDVGDFRVVGAQDVTKGDTTAAIMDLPGSAVLQTCYEIGDKMRVVGIDPV